MSGEEGEDEERSWRSTPRGDRPSEPTPAMVTEGCKALKRHGARFLPPLVPKRWLEEAARETWKAMDRVARAGH